MFTAAELHMRELVPLHQVQEAIFEFLQGREDVAVFGAQAVNLFTAAPRMTQDVDLLAQHPEEVATALADWLNGRLHIATRVREIHPATAYRVDQARREGNRQLADVRLQDVKVGTIDSDGIRYVSLVDLAALKARSLSRRRQTPKGATDLADLRRLLLTHPDLRNEQAGVRGAILRIGGGPEVLATWDELLREPLISDEEADEGY